MAKFNSKWKTEGKPNSDVAVLDYPFTITKSSGELYEQVDTPEAAEALIEFLWDNKPVDVPRSYLESLAAPLKLREAAKRRNELIKSARDAANTAEAKFQKREADARRRKDGRDASETAEWQMTKEAQLGDLLRSLKEIAKTIKSIKPEICEDTYQKLGTITARMNGLRAPLYNHHFGVTSSKRYAAIISRGGKLLGK